MSFDVAFLEADRFLYRQGDGQGFKTQICNLNFSLSWIQFGPNGRHNGSAISAIIGERLTLRTEIVRVIWSNQSGTTLIPSQEASTALQSSANTDRRA